MPIELYELVKDEIPKGVGVYIKGKYGCYSKKKAKRQELLIDERILIGSMIRSLEREAEKVRHSEDVNYMKRLNNKITELEKRIKTERLQFEKYYTCSGCKHIDVDRYLKDDSEYCKQCKRYYNAADLYETE